MPKDSDAQPLEYAPALPWYKRRRTKWWAAIFVFATIALLTPVWFPPLFQRVELKYRYQQCLAYRAPADQVVYEERLPPITQAFDPKLFNSVKPITSLIAPSWRQFRIAQSGSMFSSIATLLCHQLRDRKGNTALVTVDLLDSQSSGVENHRYLTYWPTVHLNSTSEYFRCNESRATLELPPYEHLRIFAAQLDTVDESHATIDLEMDAKRRVIDCWFVDSNLLLELRRE